jgi:ADP-heptose:LPS heptosyltransferase
MLLPVLRILLDMRKDLSIVLFTSTEMWKALELSQTERFSVRPISRIKSSKDIDFGLSLEGVVEKDHGKSRYATMPRHQIFAEALGILDTVRRREHEQDFSIALSQMDEAHASRLLARIKRPIVAIQVKGHAAVRTLPILQVKASAGELKRLGYSVIMVDQGTYSVLKDASVHQFPGTSLRIWMAILKRCEFALTMDSGIFHMAHAMNVPAICFYGPTRIEERGAFHPSFAKGCVIPIRLAEVVNCRPCFMTYDLCKGKFSCMKQVPTSILLRLVAQAALKMRSTLAPDPALALVPSSVVA